MNRIDPPHIVAIQLKIFTPVGIAMSIVVTPKNVSAIGPMPTANMWCAHTPKPRKPMRMPEYTITGYPNSGFRENVGSTSETSPNAGQDQDVDLGVAEDPEQVLPEQRVSARARCCRSSSRRTGRTAGTPAQS